MAPALVDRDGCLRWCTRDPMTESVRIALRVAPSSATAAVVGPYLEGWKLRIEAAPERGKANAAVVRLLAEVLSVPPGAVVVVAGHKSRNKVVQIEGVSLDAVNDALARASGDAS